MTPPNSLTKTSAYTLPEDGSSGQFLKTDGSGVLSFNDVDKISEGNTEAEVVDTGSDGHFKVTTEGIERFRVAANGKVGIGDTTPSTELEVNGTVTATSFAGTGITV